MPEKNVSDVVSNIGYEKIYVYASGGVVWRHLLVDVNGIDYRDVLEVAIDKAEAGCVVHVLPVLAEEDPLRETVFAGAKARKCPDLKVDGVYTEIKTPKGLLHRTKINNNIRKAYEQADSVILRLVEEVNINSLLGIVKGRFLTHAFLNKIEFKMNGIYYSYKREDMI